MGDGGLLASDGNRRLDMEFWTTDYQELERELVSCHGGREELYQVRLGVLVQALIETVKNNQSGKLSV